MNIILWHPVITNPRSNEGPLITNNIWQPARITVKHVETNPAITNLASHADVLRLVTRSSSWGGTRDKPKNVCVGGYNKPRCNEIQTLTETFSWSQRTSYPALTNILTCCSQSVIKGSLSSPWMNCPILSLLLPLWQKASLCETIGMKICHLYIHSQKNQVFFMWNI